MGRASLRFSSAIIMEIFTVFASSRQKKNETSLLFRSAFYGVFSSFYNKDIHLLTASRASCWQAFYTLLFFPFFFVRWTSFLSIPFLVLLLLLLLLSSLLLELSLFTVSNLIVFLLRSLTVNGLFYDVQTEFLQFLWHDTFCPWSFSIMELKFKLLVRLFVRPIHVRKQNKCRKK